MARLERFGAGEAKESPEPGDVILTHNPAIYGRLIRFGQDLRFHGERRKFAYWSHAAMVTGTDGEIIEAISGGVTVGNLSKYRDVEYHYVRTSLMSVDREQAVRFVRSQVGDHYAWIGIASETFTVLTQTRFQFGVSGTTFCSQLVARGLERGDYIFTKPSWVMMPADLAESLNVSPDQCA